MAERLVPQLAMCRVNQRPTLHPVSIAVVNIAVVMRHCELLLLLIQYNR